LNGENIYFYGRCSVAMFYFQRGLVSLVVDLEVPINLSGLGWLFAYRESISTYFYHPKMAMQKN
jgi:hypothetical protein